jgi:protoheme IX farnesyltransferase
MSRAKSRAEVGDESLTQDTRFVVKLFRGLAIAGVGIGFATAVLGSWVRINGAGLACPDWPLCRGMLVPALAGGVVLEWSHRLAALLEALVLVAVIVAGLRLRHRIGGLGAALAALAAIFVVQVALGGVTVFLSNSPFSVVLHWAVAMALLAVLTSVATLAVFAQPPREGVARTMDPTLAALVTTAVLAFATMCLGAFVSSSNAGLACLSLPACEGSIFGRSPDQFAQMSHRLAATLFSLAAVIAAFLAWRSGSARTRSFALAGVAFVAVQVALGAAAVAWSLPGSVREAHAANAGLAFLTFVVAAVLAAVDGPRAVAMRASLRGTLADYYELTKPRIIVLLLITTIAAMIMAAHGVPPLGLVFATLAGGALAAGSGGAFNCVIDRDIDRLMRRTMMRPVATGRISPAAATAFACGLGAVSFAILYALVNPLAAWLSLAGNFYYVVIYTMWLKRTTTLNIVIGGAAGAIPPLVGWAAVTHAVGAPAVALFALVFLWTPPHFWALALMTDTDYERAKIPMLPSVRGVPRTKVEILIYAVVMVAMSLALVPLGVMGVWYLVPAAILGAVFVFDALRMFDGGTKRHARALFKYSLVYLALMCLVMVCDRIVA